MRSTPAASAVRNMEATLKTLLISGSTSMIRGRINSSYARGRNRATCVCYHYSMLNPFPELLFLGILAPTIVRLAAGVLFISLAATHWSGRGALRNSAPVPHSLRRFFPELIALLECAIGVLLLIGLYTQIAALLGVLWSIKALFLRGRYPALFPLSTSSYVLLGAILLTLF